MSDDDLRVLARSNKIEAIRRYRERYGVGLREAKDAIDHLADTGQLPHSPSLPLLQGGTASQDVDELLRQNLKLEAIKRYREQHRVGLKEAKDAVEARTAKLGLASKTGCMVLPLALLALVVTLVVTLLAMLIH